jgi:hypothetical protein
MKVVESPSKQKAYIKEYCRLRYLTKSKQIKVCTNRYKSTHRLQIAKHVKTRILTDIQFKLSRRLRTRIRNAVRRNFKVGSAVRDLGCSVAELKLYLESLFKPGMTWDNWGSGSGKWNIDHIKPLASFDLSDHKQFLQACHFTNLQPLWWEQNMLKGRTIMI